jgi:hypothetical protein
MQTMATRAKTKWEYEAERGMAPGELDPRVWRQQRRDPPGYNRWITPGRTHGGDKDIGTRIRMRGIFQGPHEHGKITTRDATITNIVQTQPPRNSTTAYLDFDPTDKRPQAFKKPSPIWVDLDYPNYGVGTYSSVHQPGKTEGDYAILKKLHPHRAGSLGEGVEDVFGDFGPSRAEAASSAAALAAAVAEAAEAEEAAAGLQRVGEGDAALVPMGTTVLITVPWAPTPRLGKVTKLGISGGHPYVQMSGDFGTNLLRLGSVFDSPQQQGIKVYVGHQDDLVAAATAAKAPYTAVAAEAAAVAAEAKKHRGATSKTREERLAKMKRRLSGKAPPKGGKRRKTKRRVRGRKSRRNRKSKRR